jgi:hypothetical protein
MSAASPTLVAGRPRASSKLAAFGRTAIPIGIVQVAVLYAALAIKPIVGRPDPDFWWHLALGEDILSSGIPTSDTYSWTKYGDAYVPHEWLSEAIIAALQQLFGYWGNVILFDAVAIGALAVGYALAMRLGTGSMIRTALSFVAVAAMLPFVTVRPQAFTWLLFSVLVYTLTMHSRSRRTLYLLPAMFLLWSNLHLGFVYGLVVLGLFVAATAIDRLRGRDADLRQAITLLALCTAATFINPHGPALLLYPFAYLDDRQALSVITEWKSPLVFNITFIPYHIAAVLLIATLWSAWKRSTFHALLAITFVLFSFGAARNIPFVALLLVPIAGVALTRARVTTPRITYVPARIAIPGLALVAGIMLASAMNVAGVTVAQINGPNDDDYPHEGAAYAHEHLQDAHVFNHYTWGGYLMHAAPGMPVFIDGRSDFYGGPYIEDWIMIARLDPGWEALIDEYGIDAFFINRGSRLAERLREDAAWQEVFTGRTEAIFIKR